MNVAAALDVVVRANTAQATKALAGTEAQLRGTAAAANTASARVATAGKAMATRMAGVAKATALAGVAIGGVATKMAYDFEESMEKIHNLVGVSRKQTEEWGDALLDMAGKIGKSPEELADALYFVSSSGIKANKVLKTTETAAKAAALGLGDTATIADALTSAMNAYAKSGLSAEEATNVLIKTVKYGKLEADELAQSIGRVIPVSSKLKVPFDDVGAALGAMSLQGLDAAEATTALRAIFTSLIKPQEQSEAALKKIGLSAEELRSILAERGTLGMLQLLTDRFKGNVEAMGAVFPNVRALVGAFNLTGDNGKQVARIFRGLGVDTDDLGKAWKKFQKTPGQQMRRAVASMEAMMVRIGQKILPVAADAMKRFSRILTDEDLDASEKFEKILRLITEAVEKYGPKVAEAGAALGIALMRGIWRAFQDSNLLGKLFIAGGVIHLVGGGPLLRAAGAAIAKPIIAGLAATLGVSAGTLGAVLAAGVTGAVLGLLFTQTEAYDKFKDHVLKIGHLSEERMAELVQDYRDKLETIKGAIDAAAEYAKNTQPVWDRFYKHMGDVKAQAFKNQMGKIKNAIRDATDYAKGVGPIWTSFYKKMERAAVVAAGGTMRSMGRLVNSIGRGIGAIRDNTNAALKAFDVKPISFAIKTAATVAGAVDRVGGKQKGGVIVPGQGDGDKVPAMLEPGEVVWNKKAVAAMGGVSRVDAANKRFRRFQKGGRVAGGLNFALGPYDIPPIQYAADHAGGNSHVHITGTTTPWVVSIGKRLQQMGFLVGEHPAFGGVQANHSLTGGHYDALAIDVNSAKSLNESRAEVASIASLLSGKGGVMGAVVEKIKRVILEGPDSPMKEMGQNALDRVWKGANAYIASKAPTGVGAEYMSGGGGPVVTQMGRVLLANAMNAVGSAGIIGNAYQESGWNPAAVGMGGGGLFGFTTPPVSLADMQAYADKIGTKWTDVGAQVTFMLSHMDSSVRSAVNNAGSPEAAAERFMTLWERPGIPALANRQSAARRVFPEMQQLERALKGGGKRKKFAAGGIVAALQQGGFVSDPGGGFAATQPFGGQFVATTPGSGGGAAGGGGAGAGGGGGGGGKRGPLLDLGQLIAKFMGGDKDKRRALSKHVRDRLAKLTGDKRWPLDKDYEFTGRLGELQEMAARYSEYAQYAADMEGPFRGQTETQWKLQELDALLKLRNALVRAKELVSDRQKEVEKLRKDAEKRVRNFEKRVKHAQRVLGKKGKTPSGWKGEDPATTDPAKWNSLKDEKRIKLMRKFLKEGGVLPGDRKFLEGGKLVTPTQRPNLFPDLSSLNATKAMLSGSIVGPLKETVRPAMTDAMKSVMEELDTVQGSGFAAKLNTTHNALNLPFGRYGGSILSAQVALKALTADAGTSEATERLLELSRQREAAALRESALYRTQMPIFSSFFGQVPQFHTGGIVPGIGERPAMVLGGEGVFTRDQMAAMGGGDIHISVYLGDREITDIVDVQVEKKNAAIARTANARTPTKVGR